MIEPRATGLQCTMNGHKVVPLSTHTVPFGTPVTCPCGTVTYEAVGAPEVKTEAAAERCRVFLTSGLVLDVAGEARETAAAVSMAGENNGLVEIVDYEGETAYIMAGHVAYVVPGDGC